MSCVLTAFVALVFGVGSGLGCGGSEARELAPRPATSASAVASGSAGSVGSSAAAAPASPVSAGQQPLAGRTIVIDPGHQLGNHNFPAQTNRLVPAGGFSKPCNTTGTSTDAGFPEATFAWDVAERLQTKLRRQGATVLLTRHSNSEQRWGPCVDVRGRAGNELAGGGHADLKISIHGDGSYASGAHGFHVIYAPDRAPWTDDTYQASGQLALTTRAALEDHGFDVANYIAGGDGIDVRSDLGTLNLSDIPTVLVECGNMRDATDAAVMTSRSGQGRYAAAFAQAVKHYLG